MTKNKKGFTIIEVVLVLAIAGLIFLMVFIALPALQRGQRNTQRKDDIARFITAINDYQSNNNGKSPFEDKKDYPDTGTLITKYIKGNGGDAQFQDPDGESYHFKNKANGSGTKNDDGSYTLSLDTDVNHDIYFVVKAGCGELESTYEVTSGKNDVALFYVGEGGQVICNDNH